MLHLLSIIASLINTNPTRPHSAHHHTNVEQKRDCPRAKECSTCITSKRARTGVCDSVAACGWYLSRGTGLSTEVRRHFLRFESHVIQLTQLHFVTDVRTLDLCSTKWNDQGFGEVQRCRIRSRPILTMLRHVSQPKQSNIARKVITRLQYALFNYH